MLEAIAYDRRTVEPEPTEDVAQTEAAETAVDVVRLTLGKKRYRRYRSDELSRKPNCAYCGRRLTEATASLDHIMPESKKGRAEPANLVLSCEICNGAKGNRTALRWALDILRGANERHAIERLSRWLDALVESEPEPVLIAFPVPEGGAA